MFTFVDGRIMSSSFYLFEVFRRPISSLYQDLYFILLIDTY